MSEVFEIADRYVLASRSIRLQATYAGIPGHDHEMTDFSPRDTARRRRPTTGSTATPSPRSSPRRETTTAIGSPPT